MDVVQFGRWISERRRKCGWSSQRALTDTARHDPMLADYKISEDFLARLEAGRLSHPFRGNVRRQVLALAWMLCKTPREVKLYLNAAELTELSADEAGQLRHLREYLAMPPAPAVLLLSSRPSRLFGRAQVLHELISTLCTMETGVCAVTGMPGVGKSALVNEAMHMLASHERMHVFPDGIVTFSCTKRRGESGLIALLNEISAVFSQPSAGSSRVKRGATSKAISKTAEPAALSENQELPPAIVSPATKTSASHTTDTLADAIDRVRIALMDKSVLILLDDLDAHFPLRQALEALLSHSQHTTADYREHESRRLRRVVLTTGRYVPSTSLVAYHIRPGTLALEPALELFASLMRVSLARISAQDRAAMEQICAAVGYLPLAIELAANAVTVKGIPLALLAAQVSENPLDSLLDSDGILRSTFDQAVEDFRPEVRQQFFLLRTLGVQTFGLECAAAIQSRKPEKRTAKLYPSSLPALFRSPVPTSLLASVASTLGVFASHSLIELLTAPIADHDSAGRTCYRLHPLLYAYAQLCMEQIEPEEVYAARRNVQSYAEAYLECFQGDVTKLEREQKFLLAVLSQSWHQEQFTQVIRFVARLSCIVERMSDNEEGERILRWGIHASRQVQDRYHLACFLNCLGGLYCSQGELVRAQLLWQESLEIADALKYPDLPDSPLLRDDIIERSDQKQIRG